MTANSGDSKWSWRRVPLGLFVVALSACGSDPEAFPDPDFGTPHDAGSPPPSSSPDSGGASSSSSGGRPDASTPDAAPPPAVQCDPSWPVAPDQDVPGLPVGANRPSLTADERTVIYVHNTGNGSRAYMAARSALGEPFGTPLELGSNVNLPGAQTTFASLADDGLSITFVRFQNEASSVYRVERPALGEAFGAAELVRANASTEVRARDESLAFFSRNVGGNTQVFALVPANAAEANATAISLGIPLWFEPASRTLWFASFNLQGGINTNVHTRVWTGNVWENPVRSDLPVTWISPDGCRLYGGYSITHPNETQIKVRTRTLPP